MVTKKGVLLKKRVLLVLRGMETFFYFRASFRVYRLPKMKLNWIILLLTVLFLFVAGLLILHNQYIRIGVWFQMSDIHHETLALISFALAFGMLLGSVIISLRARSLRP